MSNPFVPRPTVHRWSEEIGATAAEHGSTFNRLLKSQRRLTRFIEENRESMTPATAGVATYLAGVVARMYELAGGRLRNATWAQVREASQRIGATVPQLLPLGDGFADRVRQVPWRAQPHILDEALYALFERDEASDEEIDLDDGESAKIFFLLWVVNEVLDANWSPPTGFEGEADYTFTPIEADAPPSDDGE